jgi:5-methylcytosine-specific restriction protein A
MTDHKPWATSTRRSRLPKDWAKRRAAAKARAHGMCQASVHEPQCNGIGSECDHITPSDNHALANLQWLSAPCHLAKTLREAGQASGVRGRLRPPDVHPGKINM